MSQNRLQRLARVIERQMPRHVAGTIIPRGYAVPLDKFMSGFQRFSRPIGSVFPVLTPYNTMRTTSAVRRGSSILEVDRMLPSIPLGSIVVINNSEKHFVSDIDRVTGTITLTGEILVGGDVGSLVSLHAVPVTVELAAAEGDTTINVSTPFIMVHGDVLAEVLNPNSGGSTVEVPTGSLDIIQEDEVAGNVYTLGLEKALALSYGVGDTIYLRAYPAYKSRKIPLPTQPTTSLVDNIGPLVWDYIEGRLHDGVIDASTNRPDPDVTYAVQTYSPALTLVSAMAPIEHNTFSFGGSLDSQMFLFWDIHEGTAEYQGRNTVLKPNEDGDFLIGSALEPNWPANVTYYAGFESSTDAELVIGFRSAVRRPFGYSPPSGYSWDFNTQTAYRSMSLAAGVRVGAGTLKIEPPFDYDHISIGGYSEDPACELTLFDWSPEAGVLSWVEYSILARAEGEYSWGGSGLVVKNFFRSRADLQRAGVVDGPLAAF